MKAKIFVSMAVLLAVFAVAALAAGVDGQWKATRPGQNGQSQEFTFNFKCDGNKVTGTISSPRGEIEISDGKMKGDTITFTTTMKRQDNEIKMNYKGKVSGDEISFKMSIEGMDRDLPEFTAKKVQ